MDACDRTCVDGTSVHLTLAAARVRRTLGGMSAHENDAAGVRHTARRGPWGWGSTRERIGASGSLSSRETTQQKPSDTKICQSSFISSPLP
jgi:hypothetical protein